MSIGKETTLPLHLIDKFPGNPKRDIHGVYRAGLRASLEYFRSDPSSFPVAARLIVWPVPKSKNRYCLLDGNQRIDVIKEILEDQHIIERFNLDKKAPDLSKQIRAVRASPDAADAVAAIKRDVMNMQVPVQVKDDLDREDAILFNATFNRSHAVHDEAKLISQIDLIKTKNPDIIRKIARPDRGLVQPLAPPSVPFTGSESPVAGQPYTPPADFKPSNPVEEKWGPPPPPPPSQAPSPSAPTARPSESLVPMILSLTSSGYADINNRILKCASRIFREQRLKQALEELESIVKDSPRGVELDSITVEIALLTLGRHKEAAEEAKKGERP